MAVSGIVGGVALNHEDFAGIHFTGSTGTFNHLWKTTGENLAKYKTYPRLVGETGGKDFVFAHASADVPALVTALVRGAFEYQGQKCSAASRAYVPRSLWGDLKQRLAAELPQLRVGDVRDFKNFMGAVIDAPSFAKQKQAIEGARAAGNRARILFGGECDDRTGYFVQPTVIEALDPAYDTMCTELFGPVLTLHVYAVGFEELHADVIALWFLIPIVDALRLMAARLIAGNSPFAADRNHFHHLLQELLPWHWGWRLGLYLGLVAVPGALAISYPDATLLLGAGALVGSGVGLVAAGKGAATAAAASPWALPRSAPSCRSSRRGLPTFAGSGSTSLRSPRPSLSSRSGSSSGTSSRTDFRV